MKKWFGLFVFALAILLAVPQQPEASNFREVKQVISSAVLRTAASSSAATVTTLPKNTLVTQFSTVAGGWSYVQANQYKGYVATSTLTTPKSTIKIASSKSGLVVKETASRNSKTVANLKYNMIVEDFGAVGGGWSFVQYGNVTGYVASTFIGTPKTTTKYVTGSGDYIVRNIASPSGASKGTVKGGTAVTEHSQIAGWSYISTGSLRGYIPTSQLAAKKPVVQPATLTTFTHLRPSKITWMKYYVHVSEDEYGTYSGYLEENIYDNHYSYVPTSYYGSDYYPPYTSFSPNGFIMAAPESDWVWASISTFPKANTPVPFYSVSVGDPNENPIGNSFLRTVTGTLTTPAGTFSNVVHVEQKYYDSTTSYHYYFAPGYGLLKEVSSTGQLLFELRDYY